MNVFQKYYFILLNKYRVWRLKKQGVKPIPLNELCEKL